MSAFVASRVFQFIMIVYYNCELCFGVLVFSKCEYKCDFIEKNMYFRSPAHTLYLFILHALVFS
jgi:hypothetical protein